MKIKDYLKYRSIYIGYFVIMISFMYLLFSFMNFSVYEIIVILIFVLIVFIIWLCFDYLIKNRRIRTLMKMLDGLDKKYLAGEIIPEPVNAVEKYYFEIVKTISRAVISETEKEIRDKEEYMNYVESWIHEIKTPLTACSLILDNNGSSSSLKREIKKADNFTESILFYARMKESGKSFKITEFSAADAVNESVRSQKLLLISAGCSIGVTGDFKINSDRKTFEFMTSQLLVNCAKYCKGAKVNITCENNTVKIRDNGPGIPSHEIKKITEKGYTGMVHTDNSSSTGMGLYIVSQLCRDLDIDLNIESEFGEYTEISFIFHNLTKM